MKRLALTIYSIVFALMPSLYAQENCLERMAPKLKNISENLDKAGNKNIIGASFLFPPAFLALWMYNWHTIGREKVEVEQATIATDKPFMDSL